MAPIIRRDVVVAAGVDGEDDREVKHGCLWIGEDENDAVDHVIHEHDELLEN